MKSLKHSFIASLLLSLLLSSCQHSPGVFDFRALQAKFDAATTAERLAPGGSASAASAYDEVIADLPPTKIKELNSKLRPTAWMMRSISEWRTAEGRGDKLTAATESAQNGLAANPPDHSREQALLTLVPALVIDSEAVAAWKAANKSYTADQYTNSAERSYKAVVRHLNAASDACGTGTDNGTRHYLAYQKWRTLRNWQLIIEYLDEQQVNQALNTAKPILEGRIPYDAADAARLTVPTGEPLRTLMDANSVH